jgi:hypothetical protein
MYARYWPHILAALLLVLSGVSGHSSVISAQEVAAVDGAPRYQVRYVTGRPISVLNHIGGAGNMVIYCEGDAEEILASELQKLTGEMTAAEWREVADKFLQHCQATLRKEKKRASLQYEFKEITETRGEGESAINVKRLLLRVSGKIIREPKRKGDNIITLFHPKDQQ